MLEHKSACKWHILTHLWGNIHKPYHKKWHWFDLKWNWFRAKVTEYIICLTFRNQLFSQIKCLDLCKLTSYRLFFYQLLHDSVYDNFWWDFSTTILNAQYRNQCRDTQHTYINKKTSYLQEKSIPLKRTVWAEYLMYAHIYFHLRFPACYLVRGIGPVIFNSMILKWYRKYACESYSSIYCFTPL